MTDPLERVAPLIDATIDGLSKSEFRKDPIAGHKYSKMTSVISSAYKRHGQILEAAFRQVLMQYDPPFSVWEEKHFKVSSRTNSLTADLTHLTKNENWRELLGVHLPYGDQARTLQIDAVVYNRDAKVLRAYEIKRGNGNHDSQKKRQMLRDLLCTDLLIRGYAESEGIKPNIAEAKIVFYYGVRSIPKPLSILGGELDEHFRIAVFKDLQRINSYYQKRLYELLEEIQKEADEEIESV